MPWNLVSAGVTGAPCRLEQHVRAVHVRLDELSRSLEGPIHMGLGREVDDDIRFGDQRLHQAHVAYVAVHESEVRQRRDRVEVADIAGVRELVEDDDAVLGMAGSRLPDELAADEPRTPGHEQSHCVAPP